MFKKLIAKGGEYAGKYFYKADGTLDGSHVAVFFCVVTGVGVFVLGMTIDLIVLVHYGKKWENFKEVASWSQVMAGGGTAGQIVKTIGTTISEAFQKVSKYSDDSKYNSEPNKPPAETGGQ
jgi:hypothetical protein